MQTKFAIPLSSNDVYTEIMNLGESFREKLVQSNPLAYLGHAFPRWYAAQLVMYFERTPHFKDHILEQIGALARCKL